jgi:hypothetical protein
MLANEISNRSGSLGLDLQFRNQPREVQNLVGQSRHVPGSTKDHKLHVALQISELAAIGELKLETERPLLSLIHMWEMARDAYLG